MREVTVLITACGNVYMPGTAASVKNNGERNIRLIGADMNHDDTILQMFDQYYQVPRVILPSMRMPFWISAVRSMWMW